MRMWHVLKTGLFGYHCMTNWVMGFVWDRASIAIFWRASGRKVAAIEEGEFMLAV
jgi:hypothetical protein